MSLRRSISRVRNVDGVRKETSSCLLLSDLISTVRVLPLTSQRALPYPVMDKSIENDFLQK
ncbi:MAG: hypothetical protein BWY72_02538 [Bacteroidetes bacterium ADurb.Bin416]|nr:MAG: hypothetical protein BWY72_02538 [Bacteroidetes bacterium ADurb.Bin416]